MAKKLIPWRDHIKGPILTRALFRLAIIEEVYAKKPGMKVEKQWEDFAALFFRQPELEGLEGSAKSIRDQYKQVLEKRARHHGWTDANGGVTENLSDHAGDLDEVDCNIKQILQSLEQKQEEKKMREDLSKNLEKNEMALLTQGLSKQAKEKRKYSSSSEKSNISSTSSSSMLDEKIMAFLSGGEGFIDANNSKRAKPIEQMVDEKQAEGKLLPFYCNTWLSMCVSMYTDALLNSLKGYSMERIAEESKLSLDTTTILEEISIEVLINVFCTEGKNFSQQYFKQEVHDYGLSKLAAHKIYLFLKKMHEQTCQITIKTSSPLAKTSSTSHHIQFTPTH